MLKEDIMKKLSQIESAPRVYKTLNIMAIIIRILAIIWAVLGIIASLSNCDVSAALVITSLFSVLVSVVLIYALSAIMSGIANIALNTHMTKNLLELQIKLDNDID